MRRLQASEKDRLFQPTPPVGAETTLLPLPAAPAMNFNPLRPWGRRLLPQHLDRHLRLISTHSARGGGDRSVLK